MDSFVCTFVFFQIERHDDAVAFWFAWACLQVYLPMYGFVQSLNVAAVGLGSLMLPPCRWHARTKHQVAHIPPSHM